MHNLIGQSLGRYHIIEQLGQGGMAVVYKAYDMQLEREVAIKIIHPEKGTSEKFIKRFQREAKALASLNHKNIIPVLDFGDYEGIPFLVMPLIAGGTLKHQFGKPIPYDKAARLLAPIANALAYAHSHGIIHRDIKPSNILIAKNGEPMLSDFGIAKILELEETAELTSTGVGIGTPEYMSPEQTLGKSIDGRADEYSLGIVFYEMVTGHKPYQADTPLAVAIKQNTEPLPNPRNFIPLLPEKVEHVILKSLAKDPHNRYQTMDHFFSALQELSDDNLSLSAREKNELKKGLVKKIKNNPKPWVWITSLSAFLLISICIGFFFQNNGVSNKSKFFTSIRAIAFSGDNSKSITFSTLTPTITSSPTSTKIPAKEPIVPILTPDFLQGSIVLEQDDFSAGTTDLLDIGRHANIENGILRLVGNNYSDGITSKNISLNHKGILLAFRCAPNTEAEIFLQTGTWNTNGMRRWGIYCNSTATNWIEPDVYQDKIEPIEGTFSGNLVFKPDTWYALLLTLGGPEEFIARVWEPDNPENYLELKQGMDSTWNNNLWKLGIGAAFGSIQVTNFQELSLKYSLYAPTSTPTAKPDASTFGIGSKQTLQDGMEMVFVPAGEFLMGSAEGIGDQDEHPQHTVFLDAFWIDKTEVTNAMFQKCIDAGVCDESNNHYWHYSDNPNYADHPTTYVDHATAVQYCVWVDKRLPTEAEWEKAAAGPEGNLYPWGDTAPNSSMANFNKNLNDTTKVGTYPDGISVYGVFDMAGNVWEWVSDKYSANYYASSPSSNPQGATAANLLEYVLRGGSFSSTSRVIRTTERSMDDEGIRNDIGFRCVLSAE